MLKDTYIFTASGNVYEMFFVEIKSYWQINIKIYLIKWCLNELEKVKLDSIETYTEIDIFNDTDRAVSRDLLGIPLFEMAIFLTDTMVAWE